jgi:hypothetical protein
MPYTVEQPFATSFPRDVGFAVVPSWCAIVVAEAVTNLNAARNRVIDNAVRSAGSKVATDCLSTALTGDDRSRHWLVDIDGNGVALDAFSVIHWH